MIAEIPYKQFSEELHDLDNAERIPLSGAIELTYRCNVRCVHCLTACNQFKERELKKEELFRIIDQVVEKGCLWLLLGGGEPLLREDFLDIYTYIKKKGVFIILYTNGTLITEEIADYLAKWRPFSVEITLHSMDKTVFERVTRVPGSFERCMHGIRLLLERHIPLELKTVAMTVNKDEVEAVGRYAEGLGVNYRFSAKIEPKVNGSLEPLQFRLKPGEIVELEKRFPKYRVAYEKRCQNLLPRTATRLYTCLPGFFSFHLTPYGRLLPCDMLPKYSYDLKAVSFAFGWRNLYDELKAREAAKSFRCLGCRVADICDACPGLFFKETGSEEEVSEYYCQLAQLRAQAFKGGECNEKTLQKAQD